MARSVVGPWYRKAKDAWYATAGDGKKVSLGVKGKANRKLAQEAWHRVMANGPDPKPVRDPKRTATGPKANAEAVSVKGVADAFLADAATRCKPESVCVYRSALTRFAKRFGPREAMSMGPHEAESFANRKDWTASTRNTFLSAVITAFRWAVRVKLLPANPLAGVRKPPGGSRGASAVLTPDQFQALCEAARPAFRVYLRGLYLTGCRPGELARLTARDVDFAAGVATLHEHKTAGKTGRPRLVFLSPEAVALFREQADAHPDGPLFRNSWGNGWTRFTTQKAMEAARDKAGVPHAVCYGLRHTYATDALAHGVPDATVAALLGHCGMAMLHRHYAHLTSRAEVLRQAAGFRRV